MRFERCPICGGRDLELALRYDAAPEGETPFELPDGVRYERAFRRCTLCGHFASHHGLPVDAIYAGEYADATYGDEGLARSFERIMELPPESSDNVQRVRRIVAYHEARGGGAERSVLDVGSGLAVFPARMKEVGWRSTALDPDPRAAEHARDRVGVAAVCADFTAEGEELGSYGLITFNKVLEHVEDPVAMLARARGHLGDGGFVYVEVPDGELAAEDGPGREEFFIEHVHAFSMTSLTLLASRAGFLARRTERLRVPSGKYDLIAFLERA